MAILTPTQITSAGVLLPAVLTSCAGGGDKINADKSTFIMVKNADATPHTVTIVSPGTVGGLAIADAAVVVAAAETRLIGPFAPVFIDSDEQVSLTYSSVVATTIGVFSV